MTSLSRMANLSRMTLVIRDSHSRQIVAQIIVFNVKMVDLDTFCKFVPNEFGHSGQPFGTSFGQRGTIRDNHSGQNVTTQDNSSGQMAQGQLCKISVRLLAHVLHGEFVHVANALTPNF